MLRCTRCQATAPGNARFCPACGASLTESPTFTSPPGWTPPPAADAPRAAGTILVGRYRIVGLLGRGGMGDVYRADDLKLGQPVALKFMPANLATDPRALARFHNEVRIARQVSHANVCRIYDIGEADGQQFLSMEYVDGEDLASLLRRIGRLPPDKAVDIARQLCAGLGAAHEAGVLHRDLKPANVMLDGRGRVKITDFGLAEIAEHVSPHEFAGTPAYMAPEQLRGSPPSVRSDIYALGLVLYEIFTGKAVFMARTFEERTHLGADSAPPGLSAAVRDIDPAVERVVLRCLDADPARRPATALGVAAALPGGDLLAAALAAGETPSPEMVAAADVSGALRPQIAWIAFAVTIATFVLMMALSQRTTVLNQMPHDLPPQALQVKAREILARAMPDRTVVDSAWGFDLKDRYVRFEAQHAEGGNWLRNLFRGRPAAITYWYRESRRYLISDGAHRPSMIEPPLTAGAALVELDLSGRLQTLRIVPSETPQASTAAVEWRYLFDAAGLRLDELAVGSPERLPPVFADTVMAWQGRFPGRPDLPLHVEAAALSGSPVHFEVIGPWSAQDRSDDALQPRAVDIFLLPLAFILIVSAGLLAAHNVRAGRGDRRGAARLAIAVLSLGTLTFVFQSHHVASILEFAVLAEVLESYLLTAVMFWIAYLALEPYVRRRTPDLIISWTRLLNGQVGDPLVGRDVLYGALFAGLANAVSSLHPLLAWRLGERLLPPAGMPLDDAVVPGRAIGLLATGLVEGIRSGLFVMILFVLLMMLLRRRAAAIGAFFALMYVFFLLLFEHRTPSGLLFAAYPATLMAVFVTRFGLLTTVAFHVFLFLQEFAGLTLELSAWYASPTIVAFVFTVALAFYGLFVSLGGKPFAGLGALGE